MKSEVVSVLLATMVLAVGCRSESSTEQVRLNSPKDLMGSNTPTPASSPKEEDHDQPAEYSPWGETPEPDSEGVYRFVVGGKVTEPKIVEKVPFDNARFAGRQVRGGSIVAEMVIDVDGTVRDLKLLHGVDSEMDQEFLKSLAGYIFEPATLGGKPVPVRYIMFMRIHVQ